MNTYTPLEVAKALERQVVGFSGSRSEIPKGLEGVCYWAEMYDCNIYVGCANGVDKYVRENVSEEKLNVFRASDYGVGKGSFAARSIAFVRALKKDNGALLSFPDKPCPKGLLPSSSSSKAFCGKGSGTWATLAYAVGLKIPTLVYMGEIKTPSGWGFENVEDGWFDVKDEIQQLSLF